MTASIHQRRRVVSWGLIALVGPAIILELAAAPSVSQTPSAASPVSSYRNRILGVFNGESGEAIEGAEVLDLSSRTSALTTKTGTVTLAFLPDGASVLRVRRLGYEPFLIAVEISPSDTVPLTVVLHPIAQVLPAVVRNDSTPRHISPGLQAFEERRRLGFGHFIGEPELRKEDGKKLTDVVRTLPGLGIVCPNAGQRRGECWAVSLRQAAKRALGGGNCPVDVYIDGAVATDNDLEKLRVNEFGAIEFYAGGATIPAQYNRTGSSCGVLLFWSREK